MSRDDSGAGAVVAAFVLGAVAGAAVALLMAPSSGEEMRQMLADRAREGREKAEEAARQSREFLNRQKETLTNAVERGRDAYQQARSGDQPAGGERNL